MTKVFGAIGVALVLFALPVAAAVQTAQVGQVIGEVRDVTGAVLPGATVTLTSPDRGFSRVTVSDGFGKFLFAVVPGGRYDVTVTMSKFEVKKVAGNLVEAEKTTGLSVVLKLATVEEKATVVGETPIVDPTNQTLNIRLRAEEFQKLPFNRTYQDLIAVAPGVVGTGNVNAHGALASSNVFLFDGVNTTDAVTGTFGNNINFEAIQEVIVRTATVGAEFGRATGAHVDVITKSGTNQLAGSYKFLMTNDQWNQQNSSVSEIAPNASLARTKYNHINPTYSGTMGGPVARNKAWFFAAYEDARTTTAERQTNAAPGFTPESYQQTTKSPYMTVRVSAEVKPGQNLWAKVTQSPTNGFIFDYYPGGTAAERQALTNQDQGGMSYAAQYTAVFGMHWTGEVMVARSQENITVSPFEASTLNGGAAIFDELDGRWYNSPTYNGYVRRPRMQATAAANYFTNIGGKTHAFKVGMDWQDIRSENSFKFTNAQEFDVIGFNPVTRTYTPDLRFDYDADPSHSKGTQIALYGRDRFQLGSRGSVEAGIRIEKQTGFSDVNALTIDTFVFAPRFSASFAMTPDARTLLVGSYGRFHDGILQGFSDTFSAVPQQTNYNLFVWNGSSYDFVSRFEQGASSFVPNTDVTPRYMDEYTAGVDHKVGRVLGVSARYINRKWANFIDDVRTFNAGGAISRVVANVPDASRTYRGFEFMLDRRLANHWTASANYTFSQTRGNHFADDFSAIGDFVSENCRQSSGGVPIDNGLGDANGVFPCASLQTNLMGKPSYDRPHLAKFQAAFSKPMGRFDVTTGFVGSLASKATFTKSRSVNVLLPGTLTASGQTLTYFYEPRGTDRIEGLAKSLDATVEATRRVGRASFGMKFDVFNVFNLEDKIAVNNTTWCASSTTPSCQASVNSFGTATVRNSFQVPRTMRFTFVVRY
jgi:hypothetical protein